MGTFLVILLASNILRFKFKVKMSKTGFLRKIFFHLYLNKELIIIQILKIKKNTRKINENNL